MAILKLPKEVRCVIRNGITISSIAVCVTELILNSLDAGADSVVVHLDVPHYKIQVVDNGCGITLENLKRVGIRYYTSKCRSLLDLRSNLKFHGYRGEALASLCESCSNVIIVTRPRNEGPENSYCRTFSHGKPHQPTQSIRGRACAGTTVTVQNFMYNAPVRQKRISSKIDVEEVRMQVEALSLSHPQVSFSLKDESDNSVILNVTRSQNTLETFSKLYGKEITSYLCPVNAITSGKLRIHGFISKSSHYNKRLQFIFVNDRLVKSTKLHKLINMIMRKSDVLRGSGPWQELPLPERVRDFLWVSPTKKNDRYCVFLIKIDCPLSDYDITLDPKKTLIEFSDWSSLLEHMENLVKDFLKKNNLACLTSDTEFCHSDDDSPSSVLNEVERLDKEDVLCHKLHQFKHDDDKETEMIMLNTARAICSVPAKRFSTTVKNCNKSKRCNIAEETEKTCNKIDECVLMSNKNQVNDVICQKINSTEDPTSDEIVIGEGMLNPLSTVQHSNTPSLTLVEHKRKTSKCVSSSLTNTSSSGSLGRFRKIYRQGEILSQNTPNDIWQIRIEDPPPIIRRTAPLDHRIKTLTNIKQLRNTGMNTITTYSSSNMLGIQNEDFVLPRDVKGCTLDKELQKSIEEEHKNTLMPIWDGNMRKYSGYFKEKHPTVSAATQIGGDSALFGAKCDVKGINNSLKNVVKPNLKNLNSRNKYFQKTLSCHIKTMSQKCSLINKDSKKVINVQDIHGNDCLNELKINSHCNTLNESSVEITGSVILTSEDILYDKRNLLDNHKNGFKISLKDDIIVTPNNNETVSQLTVNGNQFISDPILALRPGSSSMDCDSKSARKKNLCEFSSLPQPHKNFIQSKVDLPIHSESSKSVTNQENVSNTHITHTISDFYPEEVSDHYGTHVEPLEKPSCKERETESGLNNCILGLTMSDPSDNLIVLDSEKDNEALIENSVVGIKKTFKNQGYFKSSQKRVMPSDEISDVIKMKKYTEKSKEDNHITLKLNEYNDDAIDSLASYTIGGKSSNESLNDIMTSKVSLDKNYGKKNCPPSAVLYNQGVALIKDCNESMNNSIQTNKESTPEVISCPNDYGKNAHKSDDYQREVEFKMFARQPFLPKGLTPVMPKYSAKSLRMVNKAKDVLSSFAENESHLAQKQKWISDELAGIVCGPKQNSSSSKESFLETKSGNDESQKSIISSFLSETENKKYFSECEVMSTCVNSEIKSVVKTYNLIYPCTFSKEALGNIKMLGNIESKFIVALISMDRNMVSNALILFDQHAVHERIRLEKLFQDYQFVSKENGDYSFKNVKFKSVAPMSALEITLSSTELRMMESFQKHFERLGLHFEKPQESEHNSEKMIIKFTGIPACLSSKDAKELDPLELKEQVHGLIREQIENLVITRGVGTFSTCILRDAMNMEACRGAVKFGDSISNSECRWLLRKLSSCDSPFQCAHGRPSMYPIADVRHLENYCSENEKDNKPSLWRIKKFVDDIPVESQHLPFHK